MKPCHPSTRNALVNARITRSTRLCQCRRSVSTEQGPPSHAKAVHRDHLGIAHESTKIAVLGGGVTGLAAAFWLSKYLPEAKITLLESSSRFGGWLKSDHVEAGGQKFILEQGPRSLRPAPNAAGLATLALIRAVGLEDDVLPTSKASPAAMNRYIFYPDRLAHMPNLSGGLLPFLRDLSAPIFRGTLWPAITEYQQPPRKPSLQDESIGSFIRRRYSSPMADNIVSAVIHGIYAGDIDRLSIKTIMPLLWESEQRHGSILGGAISRMSQQQVLMTRRDRLALRLLLSAFYHGNEDQSKAPSQLLSSISKASVYTLKGGVEKLAEATRNYLQTSASNVSLRADSFVTMIEPVQKHTHSPIRVTVGREESTSEEYTHVLSALPSKALLQALSNPSSNQAVLNRSDVKILNTPAVTVMVVNLFYTDSQLLRHHGFGYLLPRSLTYDQNPELALGVVFDSEATPSLDRTPGTKLTVMIGGHWWDGWSSYPDESEAIAMAKSLLERQLGITAEPLYASAKLQKDCIPQYHVGHSERAASLGDKLQSAFGGYLEVAGASWHGVSVNDCIKSAFMAAHALKNSDGGLGSQSLRYVDWTYNKPELHSAQDARAIFAGTTTRFEG